MSPKKPPTQHSGTIALPAGSDLHHGDEVTYVIATDAHFGYVNSMGYDVDTGEWIFGNNTPFNNFSGTPQINPVTLSSAAWQSGPAHIVATLHATNSDGQSGDQVLDSIKFDVAA